MTAPIITRFGFQVAEVALEAHAAFTREHLERPLRHARFGATGSLWQRVADHGFMQAQAAGRIRRGTPEGTVIYRLSDPVSR